MSIATADRGIPAPLLGMILFIASEVMFFGSLFAAYFTLRASATQWPPSGTPEISVVRTAFFSLFLITSSGTVHVAVSSARRRDRRALMWLGVTMALGALFLAGQALEYAELSGEGFTAGSNVYGSLFFTMTGFHGLHVAGGLAAMALVAGSARGRDPAANIGPVEAVSYYWHFVDVVWVLLFGTLYLLR